MKKDYLAGKSLRGTREFSVTRAIPKMPVIASNLNRRADSGTGGSNNQSCGQFVTLLRQYGHLVEKYKGRAFTYRADLSVHLWASISI